MKKWAQNLLAFASGTCLTLVTLEVIFRLLPVPMGLYRTEQHERWPLVKYESHQAYTSSMSWEMRHVRHGTTNNYGHLAPFDYVRGSRPIIVVGDSFVDSQMNHYEDTLQGILGVQLGLRESVYGLGANGLSISDYLALSALAQAEFTPKAAVFLLTDGDISESLLGKIGHYSFVANGNIVRLVYRPLFGETYGKKLRRLFGDSALYRYVQLNLRFEPQVLLDKLINVLPHQKQHDVVQSFLPTTSEMAIVDHFLRQLPLSLKLPQACIAILVHSDTYALADPASAITPKDSPQLLRYFNSRAKEMGFRIIDLRQRLQSEYARHGKRLDFWPLDRHLNGRGHKVAARAAYEALMADAGSNCIGHPYN